MSGEVEIATEGGGKVQKKTGRRRVVAISVAAVLVLAAAVGGLAYWQIYRTSPQYSLKMLGRASAMATGMDFAST